MDTHSFAIIKKRKTKRLSPYLETELWDRDELLSIIKYEPYKRNKAALALLWDLDARPHEVTLLKIKHIRLRERYGEGEIPHEAKTGTGPILLTCSFPYVRDSLFLPVTDCIRISIAPVFPSVFAFLLVEIDLK